MMKFEKLFTDFGKNLDVIVAKAPGFINTNISMPIKNSVNNIQEKLKEEMEKFEKSELEKKNKKKSTTGILNEEDFQELEKKVFNNLDKKIDERIKEYESSHFTIFSGDKSLITYEYKVNKEDNIEDLEVELVKRKLEVLVKEKNIIKVILDLPKNAATSKITSDKQMDSIFVYVPLKRDMDGIRLV